MSVFICPTCRQPLNGMETWREMKARAEEAEAKLKAQAESGIWTTVEDMCALRERLAQAEAQAAAMLVVEQDSEGRVSHICNADLAEKGRALLSRLRCLEDVAEAARAHLRSTFHGPGCNSGRCRCGMDESFAALSRLDALKETK